MLKKNGKDAVENTENHISGYNETKSFKGRYTKHGDVQGIHTNVVRVSIYSLNMYQI
jgi:hypothetical protein